MPNRKGKSFVRQQLDCYADFLTFSAGRGGSDFLDPEHFINLVMAVLGVNLDVLGALQLFVIVILQKAPAGELHTDDDTLYHEVLLLALPQLFLLSLHKKYIDYQG